MEGEGMGRERKGRGDGKEGEERKGWGQYGGKREERKGA